MNTDPTYPELVIAMHQGEPLTLDDNARRRHVHVVGQTGTGKTTLIKNLIAQDLAAGRGVALIDPLGHLAQAVLSFVPPHRTHQVVYVDPADMARPIGFNILEQAHPDKHAVIADDIVSAFIHIWGDISVGDRSQQVLRNSVRALLSLPTATLLCIPRLLTDDEYRSRAVRAIRDPVVLTYWTKQFAQYDDTWRNQVISPILNKLDAVLSAPELRNIIGQPKSTIDLRRIMDEGRILIVNLSKGRLGESNAHILGALIITKLAQAAFAREDIPQNRRRPFYLYADEFQDYSSAGFMRILSQARNYALALCLAHQYLGQLTDPLRDAVLGNAASFIALRVGAQDAPILAAHLGLDPNVELSGMGQQETAPEKRLATLPNYRAFGRLLIDDTPTEALPLDLYDDPPAINPHPERLIEFSRQRYGRGRPRVEDKIARFFRGA